MNDAVKTTLSLVLILFLLGVGGFAGFMCFAAFVCGGGTTFLFILIGIIIGDLILISLLIRGIIRRCRKNRHPKKKKNKKKKKDNKKKMISIVHESEAERMVGLGIDKNLVTVIMYIRKSRKAGQSDEVSKKKLINAGWDEELINKAIKVD